MDSSEVNSYLDTFVNFESQLHKLRPEDFHLNRIQKFLDLAGHPSQNLKIVHVAGTKGKGSTCVLTAGILQQLGFSVGLYTSPHLLNVRERIRVLRPETFSSSKNPGVDCISKKDFASPINLSSLILSSIIFK